MGAAKPITETDVWNYLDNHKSSTSTQLYKKFPSIKSSTMRRWLAAWRKVNTAQQKQKKNGRAQGGSQGSLPKNKTPAAAAATTPGPAAAPQQPSIDIPTIIRDAISNGKDIPPSIFYLIAAEKFAQNPSPQWFAVLMNYTKDKDKLAAATSTAAPIINYQRPIDKLAPKQIEVLNLLWLKRMVFIEGARRTRKSTTGWQFLCEYLTEAVRKCLFVGANENSAIALHEDRYYGSPKAPWIFEQNKELISYHVATKSIFKNGSEFIVRNTKSSGSKGLSGDVIMCDETDQIMIQNPKTIADIVAVAIDRPDMKIIFMANRPDGEHIAIFQQFRKIFHDFTYWTKSGYSEAKVREILDAIAFITLEPKDIPETYGNLEDPPVNVAIAGAIQRELMGEEYMGSQLGNKEPISGVTFPNAARCVENFKAFQTNFERMGGISRFNVLVVDPGHDHPVGYSVWGVWRGVIFEHESGDFEGKNVTEDFLKNFFADLARDYNCLYIVLESNSGGKWWGDDWERMGFIVVYQNYGANTSINSQSEFIHTARKYMANNRLVFFNEKLLKQMQLYNIKAGRDTKHKGDIADTCIHVIFYIDRNPQLFKEEAEKVIW